MRVPRSLIVPAERAESRARLRWVFCCGTQESCVYAVGGGWLCDSALVASAHNSLTPRASVKLHARPIPQALGAFFVLVSYCR